MAARKTYGNTWWGKRFLQALQQIDFSNRLPRGRTYANRGSVRKITIEDGEILSEVQGSRRWPYHQEIRLSQLSRRQQKRIVETVAQNPLLLSRLLNREMPPELEETLEMAGISLFPKSWDSVSATCSCPDWALPCKHLAAVFYVVANEVDKNPFLIFSLKGMDLIKALEEEGFTKGGHLRSQLPAWESQLRDTPETSSAISLEALQARLDFSRIPPCREKLLRLLAPRPAFYSRGNFHQRLETWYLKLPRHLKKWSLPPSEMPLPVDLEAVTVVLDDYLELTEIIVEQEEVQLVYTDWLEFLPDLLITQASLHLSVVPYLQWLWQFGLHLIQQSALIPHLCSLEEGTIRLRWIPAHLDGVVAELQQAFFQAWPEHLEVCQQTEMGERRYLSREEELRSLQSLLLEPILQSQSFREPEDPVEQLFFSTFTWYSEKFEEAETPHAIQQWLQRFYLTDRDWGLVLKIEEDEEEEMEEDEEEEFALSFWIEDKTDLLLPLVPLWEMLGGETPTEKRLTILQDLAALLEFLPQMKEVIRNQGRSVIALSMEELPTVLLKTLPALELVGVRILLPKSLKKLARPQLSLRLEEHAEADGAAPQFSLLQMLDFQWQVAVGDQLLDPKAFLAAVGKAKGLVKIQDTYLLIDDKEMQALLKQLQQPPQMSPEALLQAALSESYEGAQVKITDQALKLIQELRKQKRIAPPRQLQATLRPYQKRGYGWLYKNDRIGFGSILADDMGLGKTLQVISFLARLKQEKQLDQQQALVVVPTTLLSNWEREIARFAPQLRPHIFHGPGRELDPEADLILTSYGVARSDVKRLSKPQWRVLVIDEAQAIKNPGTAQAKALKKFTAQSRIAMSGTPVENRLSEYWSIMDFVNRGYLSTLNRFKKRFIEPIEADHDQDRLKEFLAITDPFILRRLKTDKSIITDLPEKIVQDQYCHLSEDQAALYQGLVDHNLDNVGQAQGIERAGLIFKLMTALKQICNHPSHYLKKEQIDPALSGKAQQVLTILEQIRERGEKVLIFTQYRAMGDLLVRMLQDHFPEPPLFLHGGLSRKKRDELVSQFQEKPYHWAFILSLKAAGTGLNLTAANHVIHYDLWWNPAVEAQATDRAFRIGQKKQVQVHRLITQGTFEERINEMMQSKRELANLTVKTGESWIGELPQTDLRKLFRLSKEK
ncbi:MAG: DEAD/DEAH box helicase [Bacteroidota bacterium]